MKLTTIAAAMLAAGFGTAVVAQDAAPSKAETEKLAVLPEFKAVDANEDGMIDVAETESLAKMLEEEHQVSFEFDTVDKNEDGLINTQEYVAYDAMLGERLGIA